MLSGIRVEPVTDHEIEAALATPVRLTAEEKRALKRTDLNLVSHARLFRIFKDALPAAEKRPGFSAPGAASRDKGGKTAAGRRR